MLALNWIRVSWFRAAAPLPAQHPRAARRAVPPAQIHARISQLPAADRDAGNVAVGEIHAGKRCLKQLRPNEQATFECGLCRRSRQRRVRQVAVGKACVPYFRAEVAITRNAVDQRYVEQKRFRERCANELAVRKARVRSSEAFCRFTFEQSQCSKTQSMNAARSSAMPLMRQPVKQQFRNVSPKSPSVSVRFSNRTNSTSVSSSAACENSAARSAQRVLQLWRVVFHINTGIAHTATRVQQTRRQRRKNAC